MSRNDERRDEELVGFAYTWLDVEEDLPKWRSSKAHELETALSAAFRVEVRDDDFLGPHFAVLFDYENPASRKAAATARSLQRSLDWLVQKHTGLERAEVHLVSPGSPIRGQICKRRGENPEVPDLSDIPTEPPESSVPLVERDHYHLTPIEVPFYDALRETGLVFAVQPWIQGDRRYRPDFLVFYDGGTVAIELDGHEYHKTKEQRRADAARDRWFAARGITTLRWTGSDVAANPQACVKELLDVLRGAHARP